MTYSPIDPLTPSVPPFMADHCENSATKPCPNKPYDVIEGSTEGAVLFRFTLCRKHYNGVMADERKRAAAR